MVDSHKGLSEGERKDLPGPKGLGFRRRGSFLPLRTLFSLTLFSKKAVKLDIEIDQTALESFNFCQQSVVVLFRGKIQQCKQGSHALVYCSLRR